jgi:hypothetical protein
MKAKAIITLCVLSSLPAVLTGQVFNFLLSSSQTTAGTATGSAGYATVELSGNVLNYNVVHTGVSGGLTAIHFHGAAGPGVNAGVQIGLTAGSSPITGTTGALTAGQISDLTSGLWYLNLHSGTNPGGELRGQVASQLSFSPNNVISGSQEVSPVVTPGAGAAYISLDTNTNVLSWDIAYEGLSSSVTGMHFHGPANAAQNAEVQVNVGSISGLASESSGSTVLTAGQASDLLGGLWYLNIHTTNVGSGEIRGQITSVNVVPEPASVATAVGIAALLLTAIRRRLHSQK